MHFGVLALVPGEISIYNYGESLTVRQRLDDLSKNRSINLSL